jgi:hypothetical protein
LRDNDEEGAGVEPYRWGYRGSDGVMALSGDTDANAAPRPEPLRILSLTGGGRSGSTILGNVLGQASGLFHAGEVCYLWNRGVQQDALCGCGRQFSECPVWQEVMATTGMDVDAAALERLIRFPRAGNRRLPLLMLSRRLARRAADAAEEYAAHLGVTYAAISAATGAEMIIDSSKTPSHIDALSRMPNLDLRVVHLLRDPRAVAHSWHRRLARDDVGADRPREMDRAGIARGALKWGFSNAFIEAAVRALPRDRVLRIHYEEFARHPAQVAHRVLAFAGVPDAALPFASENEIDLRATHTVWGNPNRLKTGATRLRPDDAWRTEMSLGHRAVVTGITLPWLLHYGYRPTSSAGGAESRNASA